MPLSEYIGWIEYFMRAQDAAEGKQELAEMTPEQIAAAFGANVS